MKNVFTPVKIKASFVLGVKCGTTGGGAKGFNCEGGSGIVIVEFI